VLVYRSCPGKEAVKLVSVCYTSVICVLGDQLVVNCYEPLKASQQWSVEGPLLRWHGCPPGEWQVAGVKPPVGPQEVYLHVGPLDTLRGTQWMKEFVDSSMHR